jgi:hypothetical protein
MDWISQTHFYAVEKNNEYCSVPLYHRLNMEVDLQSLFWPHFT